MADAHLYGVKTPKNQHKPIESSTALAFSSHLSSLISRESTKGSSSTHSRPSKGKQDIFTAQKQSKKKRTHDEFAGSASQNVQKHKNEQDLGGSLDSSDLSRSRRRMEEKVRLYAAMKRGDYVASTTGHGRDEQNSSLIDFDRKWAERTAGGEHPDNYDTSSDSEQDSDDNASLHDYTDEMGRTRQATRTQIARMERDRRIASNFARESESLRAHPTMPSNIIHGDTVQHNAFNPDDTTATAMAELAAKRDRSATPPPDTHYDASQEIRNKGTGFYAFSQDKQGRTAEFEALEQERRETEKRRQERASEKERRRKQIEERRKKVGEVRAKKEADRFLEGLGVEAVDNTTGISERATSTQEKDAA